MSWGDLPTLVRLGIMAHDPVVWGELGFIVVVGVPAVVAVVRAHLRGGF